MHIVYDHNHPSDSVATSSVSCQVRVEDGGVEIGLTVGPDTRKIHLSAAETTALSKALSEAAQQSLSRYGR